MGLGTKKISEVFRIYLTIQGIAPTGTPQIAIDRQGTSVVAATNMTQGASTLIWYYSHTVASDATVGAYQATMSAVLAGVTQYAVDNFDVKANDSDDIITKADKMITDFGVTGTGSDTDYEGSYT